MKQRTMATPFGPMHLTEENGALTGFTWGCGGMDTSPLLLEAERQLCAYFQGTLKQFDLPLAPRGTSFQQKVWAALCTIPYGETRSYGEIAAQVGNPKACRAVGMANNRNPLAVIVPCHRVIGANGSLTGYAAGLDVKTALLALEQKYK